MSWLSSALHAIGDFLAENSSDPTVSNASTQIKSAADAAEQALPVLTADAANLVISKVPGGALFQPLLDAFIEGVVANLLAKHSNPAAAKAALAAS